MLVIPTTAELEALRQKVFGRQQGEQKEDGHAAKGLAQTDRDPPCIHLLAATHACEEGQDHDHHQVLHQEIPTAMLP